MTLRTPFRAIPVSLPLAAALAGSLALSGCGAANETANASGGTSSGSAPQLTGSLNGAGSTAQQAAMQAWSAGFNSAQPQVTVNYDPVGSGGGREQWLAGGVAFAGSFHFLMDPEKILAIVSGLRLSLETPGTL